MKVTIVGTGLLRELFPGKRGRIELELDHPVSVQDIVEERLGINPLLVVAVSVAGRQEGKEYVPGDGEEITLIAPLAGG